MSTDLVPFGKKSNLIELACHGFMRACVWGFHNPGKAILVVFGAAVVLLIL